MKGLERSRQLFEDHVMPKLQEELPEVIPLLAAGLVGEGSECFGYDDAVSLDHDAETRICLWLDQEHYPKYADALNRILMALPKEIDGNPVHPVDGWRSGVFEIGSFYHYLIGLEEYPASNRQWLETEETRLAAAVNGEVFFDPYGAFTKIRKQLLMHYPQDVFLLKLAQAIAVAAQTGQYNYPRAVRRNDAVTANMIRATFIDYFVRAVFLLNRTYRPFYKWTYQALSALPVLGKEMHEKIEALLNAPWDGAEEGIEEMSQKLIGEMQRQQLTENTSDFLMDHLPDLLSKVEDKTLLEKGISLII
ncbi:MAG: DUF4037 domain-containing protein [Lachnospiraceae bacterium]|nr:DUF4037 domain-containing protein [Lachnospiraceae bacterium]